MSHYGVLHIIPDEKVQAAPGNRVLDKLNHVLEKRMQPFDENADRIPAKFTEFNNMETDEEILQKWEEGKTEKIKLPGGELCSPWDDRFKDPGQGMGFSTSDKYTFPEGSEKVEVAFKDLYDTFEQYLEDWYGATKDSTTGKYGYWHNPNGKWDYWLLGGRWAGYLPIRAGTEPIWRDLEDWEKRTGHHDFEHMEGPKRNTSSACQFQNLNLDEIGRKSAENLADFFDKFNFLVREGKYRDDDQDFYNSRNIAVDIGVMACKEEKDLTDEERPNARFWRDEHEHHKESTRCDVLYPDKVKELKQFSEEFGAVFFSISTYTFFDEEKGWVSPGDMGWWGMSSDSPDTYLPFKNAYRDRVLACEPTDWLAILDCHT